MVRSGTSLTLGGQPYRFVGFDIYGAASNGACTPTVDIKRALGDIVSKHEVFRTWFFQSWATTKAGRREWAAFDHVLASARAAGVRVIPTLANEWNYCDGAQKDLPWFESGYRTTVQPGESVPYLEWVREVVTRYANNPTIAMWDLVNEASAETSDGTCHEGAAETAMRSFTDDVGGLVHQLDHHHPVIMGSVSGQCGTQEGDYQLVYASPGTDICDYHDYGFPYSPMGNTGTADGLAVTIDRCHADGKPLAVLESGIHWTQLQPSTLTERAILYGQKLKAQFAAGSVGELLWDYAEDPQTRYPADYEIGPQDPVAQVLRNY